MHNITQMGLDGPPFLLLAPEGLRETVPRPQLHVFVFGLADRDFRAQAVILQVAIAILVEQYAAFPATPFGHQDATTRQTGRMVLHELHVA